jgi:hypothetical protein
MGSKILGVIFLLSMSVAGAEQHPACASPELEYFEIPAKALLAIAESCERPQIASLFRKRAYLRELMDEYDSFNSLLTADRSNRAYFEAYRILIGLAEAFAVEALAKGDTATLTRLSRTYDHYIEIAELRLKGYDLIANRMERELRL